MAIATLGPVGYLPAPGTCGSLVAIFLLGLMRKAALVYGFSSLFLTAGGMLIAFWVIRGALLVTRQKDPQCIVIDEVIGFFIAMYALPFTFVSLALAFIFFRFFDIEKPLGIKLLEELPGAWGILADDVSAGLLASFSVSWLIFFLQAIGVGNVLA